MQAQSILLEFPYEDIDLYVDRVLKLTQQTNQAPLPVDLPWDPEVSTEETYPVDKPFAVEWLNEVTRGTFTHLVTGSHAPLKELVQRYQIYLDSQDMTEQQWIEALEDFIDCMREIVDMVKQHYSEMTATMIKKYGKQISVKECRVDPVRETLLLKVNL